MEAQELINSLKKQPKWNFSTKKYQAVCSILGNVKSTCEKEFLTTENFYIVKESVRSPSALSQKVCYLGY